MRDAVTLIKICALRKHAAQASCRHPCMQQEPTKTQDKKACFAVLLPFVFYSSGNPFMLNFAHNHDRQAVA